MKTLIISVATSCLAVATLHSAATGEVLWQFKATSAISSPISVSREGRAYFASRTNFHAIASDGTVLWSRNGNHSGRPPVLVGEDIVIFSNHGNFSGVDAANGKGLWQHRSDHSQTGVAFDEDRNILYIGDSEWGKTAALNPLTGRVIRKLPFPSGFPTIGPDGELFYTSSNSARANEPVTGSTYWSTNHPVSGPRFDNSAAIDSSYRVWSSRVVSHRISTYDGNSGSVITIPLSYDPAVPSSFSIGVPAIGKRWIALHVKGGPRSEIRFIDQANFQQGHTVPVTSPDLITGAWGSDDAFYYATESSLYSVDPSGGSILFVFDAGSKITGSPCLDERGRVLIGTEDGVVYAIQASAPLANTTWPMAFGNPRRTSHVPGPFIASRVQHQRVMEGVPAMLQWRIAGQGAFQWLRDGIEIVGATNANLQFVSPTIADAGEYKLRVTGEFRSIVSEPVRLEVNLPGSKKWSTPLAAPGSGTLILASSNLLVTSTFHGDGNPRPRPLILGLDRHSGSLKWKAEMGSTARLLMSDAAGNVVGSAPFSELAAFSPDGDVYWRKTGWASNLAIDSTGFLFAQYGAKYPQTNVVRYSILSGDESIEAILPGTSFGYPVIVNRTVYFDSSRKLAQVNLDTHTLTLLQELDFSIDDIAVGNTGTLYVRGYKPPSLAAYDPASGVLLWQRSFPWRSSQTTVDADERLFLVDSHVLHALDGTTGATLWTRTNESQWGTSPTLGRGELYLGTHDKVVALDSSSGATNWEFYADGKVVSRLLLDSEGTLYIATEQTITALHGATPLAQSSWPIAEGNPQGSRSVQLLLTPPLLLTAVWSGTALRVELPSTPGASYQLLISTDLINWIPGPTVTANSNRLALEHEPNSQSPAFYRVLRH